MTGELLRIFIVPDRGIPMQEVNEIQAIAGAGLQGDRYALERGFFSRLRKAIRHVSLISMEAITECNLQLDRPFMPDETRRNLLTSGVDLNGLVGKEFTVGTVLMRGTELCAPCNRPGNLVDKSGFKTAYDNRGGLRAEILTSGLIRVGDNVC